VSFKEANTLRMRALFAIALLVPFLATSLPAQAAKMDARAARAECFRKANEAANVASLNMGSDATGETQSAGMDAYRPCCYRWAYGHNDSVIF
jgi:hypothetical protein